MKLQEITNELEAFAPLILQESYDNAGLLIGNKSMKISSALLTIDVTEEVLDEAIALGDNLIISHHPLIFTGIKKINQSTDVERCIVKAISNNIAIYAAHTNMDAVAKGVNKKLCDKFQIKNTKILKPISNFLFKINVYVPFSMAGEILRVMFETGAGQIGNYDSCSFKTKGIGTFKANDLANPYVGEKGKLHEEEEVKIEVICAKDKLHAVIEKMKEAHPYEEPAFEIITIENKYSEAGSGIIGELDKPTDCIEFLNQIKNITNCNVIRHTAKVKTSIKKVAICGGSGSFLISEAKKQGADIYLTSDIKYHDFLSVDNKMIIADIGHYESEQFTKEIFYEILNKKFPTFALHFSKVITNPINYL